MTINILIRFKPGMDIKTGASLVGKLGIKSKKISCREYITVFIYV